MKALALLPLLTLAACDLSMANQQKSQAQGSASLWPGGPPRAAPPDGTIAQDEPARRAAITAPPPLTLAGLQRGEQRYTIFCAPCHGATGNADGTVVKRGFPAPPSLHDPRLAAMPPAAIVAVISHGKGIMYPLSDRIPPEDRWRIAAHVKLLQQVGNGR